MEVIRAVLNRSLMNKEAIESKIDGYQSPDITPFRSCFSVEQCILGCWVLHFCNYYTFPANA